MSRNDGKKDSSASAFRKIDVDQYNDNNFKEEDADGGLGGPTANILSIFLTLTHTNIIFFVTFLSIFLNDNARNLTLKVLLSIKSNQIDDCLTQLDRDLLDVLMKYIYRGFEIPTEGSSSHLLIWHEKVYNISGVGSIVRAFSDSKRA
ncbi:Actin-related protein 2/3 complex subunit 5 [Dufourea novaeangliae]|uniref:Actin-related protein 2/3 complex subunit 5 n=1 Tax=Dufourea novaeangliae TaxID=178035 RepID=A0A154PKC1_DUFNO|nr:Actin-related protein 2/3 complex subunit 5 [Dufourea novaeangliae]